MKTICTAITLLLLLRAAGASDTTATNTTTAEQPDTLRAYLQVQEQLHTTQLALERNRQDAEDMAARNALAIGDRLNLLEKMLGEQRDRDAHTNHTLLIGAAALAAAGFLALLISSFMQMRAMHRFAEAVAQTTYPPPALAATPDTKLLANGAATEANTRLRATIERLENRIRELESAKPARPTLEIVAENGQPKNNPQASQIEALLAKGQSLLNLGQAESALATFDQALALDTNHIEALIKKGAALEKLSRLDDAVACYDRAIAADRTVTIAYLYKGGVFNRMERYNEALTCYEQALKSQEKAHAA